MPNPFDFDFIGPTNVQPGGFFRRTFGLRGQLPPWAPSEGFRSQGGLTIQPAGQNQFEVFGRDQNALGAFGRDQALDFFNLFSPEATGATQRGLQYGSPAPQPPSFGPGGLSGNPDWLKLQNQRGGVPFFTSMAPTYDPNAPVPNYPTFGSQDPFRFGSPGQRGPSGPSATGTANPFRGTSPTLFGPPSTQRLQDRFAPTPTPFGLDRDQQTGPPTLFGPPNVGRLQDRFGQTPQLGQTQGFTGQTGRTNTQNLNVPTGQGYFGIPAASGRGGRFYETELGGTGGAFGPTGGAWGPTGGAFGPSTPLPPQPGAFGPQLPGAQPGAFGPLDRGSAAPSATSQAQLAQFGRSGAGTFPAQSFEQFPGRVGPAQGPNTPYGPQPGPYTPPNLLPLSEQLRQQYENLTNFVGPGASTAMGFQGFLPGTDINARFNQAYQQALSRGYTGPPPDLSGLGAGQSYSQASSQPLGRQLYSEADTRGPSDPGGFNIPFFPTGAGSIDPFANQRPSGPQPGYGGSSPNANPFPYGRDPRFLDPGFAGGPNPAGGGGGGGSRGPYLDPQFGGGGNPAGGGGGAGQGFNPFDFFNPALFGGGGGDRGGNNPLANVNLGNLQNFIRGSLNPFTSQNFGGRTLPQELEQYFGGGGGVSAEMTNLLRNTPGLLNSIGGNLAGSAPFGDPLSQLLQGYGGGYGAPQQLSQILNQGLPGQNALQSLMFNQLGFGGGLQNMLGNWLGQVYGQGLPNQVPWQQAFGGELGAGQRQGGQAEAGVTALGSSFDPQYSRGLFGSASQDLAEQQARKFIEGGTGLSPDYVSAVNRQIFDPQREALLGRLNRQGGGQANLESGLFERLKQEQERDFTNILTRTGFENLQSAIGQAGQLGAQRFGQGLQTAQLAGNQAAQRFANAGDIFRSITPAVFPWAQLGAQTGESALDRSRGIFGDIAGQNFPYTNLAANLPFGYEQAGRQRQQAGADILGQNFQGLRDYDLNRMSQILDFVRGQQTFGISQAQLPINLLSALFGYVNQQNALQTQRDIAKGQNIGGLINTGISTIPDILKLLGIGG